MFELKRANKTSIGFLVGIAFLIFSWPFTNYPITDADINNWAHVSIEMMETGEFLTTESDQGHGPLMAWTGALSMMIFGKGLYQLNLFNLLMGVLGVFLMYYFPKRFWQNESVARLSSFLFATSISTVYLSHTPMYDWPATICYLTFFGFYYLYIKESNTRDFIIACIAIGIGSLSRFSICWGLAGFYMIFLHIIYKRSWWLFIRDGFIVTGIVGAFNLPWLIAQGELQGGEFFKTFLYDNTGRYVKSTRVDAYVRKDFYGFPIYVLVGMLPYTFCVIASFFKKGIWQRLKSDKLNLTLLAAFLPCFLLFSFSGHTKLARYIAYVFPALTMLLAHFMVTYDLDDKTWRKKCKTMILITAGLLAALLTQQAIQFSEEVKSSLLFVSAVVMLLFPLLGVTAYLVTKKAKELKEDAYQFLTPFAGIYLVFFSILSYEYLRAPFLNSVRLAILEHLGILQ